MWGAPSSIRFLWSARISTGISGVVPAAQLLSSSVREGISDGETASESETACCCFSIVIWTVALLLQPSLESISHAARAVPASYFLYVAVFGARTALWLRCCCSVIPEQRGRSSDPEQRPRAVLLLLRSCTRPLLPAAGAGAACSAAARLRCSELLLLLGDGARGCCLLLRAAPMGIGSPRL